jgi:hypothetical protein
MTVLERKAYLMKAIFDVQDETILDDIDGILQIHYTHLKPPCRYTVEEIKEGIRKSVEDVEAGRYMTLDDLEKVYQ